MTNNHYQALISAVHELGHFTVAESLGYEAKLHIIAGVSRSYVQLLTAPTVEHDTMIAIAGFAAEQLVYQFAGEDDEPMDLEDYVAAKLLADDGPYSDGERSGTEWQCYLPAVEAILTAKLSAIAEQAEVIAQGVAA